MVVTAKSCENSNIPVPIALPAVILVPAATEEAGVSPNVPFLTIMLPVFSARLSEEALATVKLLPPSNLHCPIKPTSQVPVTPKSPYAAYGTGKYVTILILLSAAKDGAAISSPKTAQERLFIGHLQKKRSLLPENVAKKKNKSSNRRFKRGREEKTKDIRRQTNSFGSARPQQSKTPASVNRCGGLISLKRYQVKLSK